MLYVYGVVDSPGFDTIRGKGHEGADVIAVTSGEFAAAASHLPASAIGVTRESVWLHETVLERLMQDHAVVPLRFGTICRDEDALRECLRGSAGPLVNDFAHVRGKVELALRVAGDGGGDELPDGCARVPARSDAPGDGEPAGRGAAYLRARLRYHHSEMARADSAKRLEDLLRRQLGAVLSDIVCTAPAEISASFRISCLVERDRITAFAAALDRFREDHPQFAITCTGPWAPYSFVAAPPVAMGAS